MTPNWKRNGLLTLLVLIGGGSVAYGLLVGKPGPESQPIPDRQAPAVTVVSAAPTARELEVHTQGTVRPLREINLVAQVAGKVESVAPQFAAGGFFQAGERLLKIEDVDYGFAIARAESQVAASAQAVAEERGRTLQAKREWRDLGSVQANDLFLRKPQLAAAEAALAAAKADLGAAELELQRTAISLPFNGRISEKYVDVGQYVAPGTAVAKVYDTDVAEVRLPLTDRQVALLDLPLSYANGEQPGNPGAAVTLSARFAGRQWQWQGEIVRTDASIDVNSRVVYAVAEVTQPFAREAGSERPPLAPGLFVNATISGRQIAAVSELPRSALRADDTVLLVDTDNRVQRRTVRVLRSTPTQLWLQGVESGERVIVDRGFDAVVGTAVRVKSDTAFAASEAP